MKMYAARLLVRRRLSPCHVFLQRVAADESDDHHRLPGGRRGRAARVARRGGQTVSGTLHVNVQNVCAHE